MKIKIYNKKAPLATFEALNQRNLEEMLHDGKIYNSGLNKVLSETLKKYENVQNTVNFTSKNFNPIEYFTLIFPRFDSEVAIDSARLFEQENNPEVEVSLLDFSDYNINLNESNVVNKFNSTANHTLGDVIDFPEDSCLDLLKDMDDEIREITVEGCNEENGEIDLCDFTLGPRKFDLKENRRSTGHKRANFGRGKEKDNIYLKLGRKTVNVLSSKNQNKPKGKDEKSAPFLDFSRYKKDQNKLLKKQKSMYHTRNKTPNPGGYHHTQGDRRSAGNFLSPPPQVSNCSSMGIAYNSVFQRDKKKFYSNTDGNVTPMKFGKKKSKKDMKKKGKVCYTQEGGRSCKANSDDQGLNVQKIRFTSKSPIFMKLRNRNNKNKKKSRSPMCGRPKIYYNEFKKKFTLNEKSKRLLASKPTRASIPSKFHQQLIKLIDGFGSKFDFSDSSKNILFYSFFRFWR